MSALLELAERVEAAAGPDRELDARIFWETGEFVRLAGSEYASRRDVEAFGVFYGRNPKKAPADLTWADVGNRCPNYTASLDFARSLVPEGWHVGMLTECDEDDFPAACLTENDEPCRDAVGNGADMRLSLCAAALRARAAGGSA